MNLDGLMIMGQIFLITRDFLWLNSPWDFLQPKSKHHQKTRKTNMNNQKATYSFYYDIPWILFIQ